MGLSGGPFFIHTLTHPLSTCRQAFENELNESLSFLTVHSTSNFLPQEKVANASVCVKRDGLL